MSLSVFFLTLPITWALTSVHDAVPVIPPALLAGMAEAFTNGTYLTLFTVAGVLALAKGLGLPSLWLLSVIVGVVASQLGGSMIILGLALMLLYCGWLLTGKYSASEAWIALLGTIACGLPFTHFGDGSALTGSASVTAMGFSQNGWSLGLTPWAESSAVVYFVGLLLGLLITSLTAYQAAFWLSWHLGERSDTFFRFGRLIVCGIAFACFGRSLLGL